MSATMDMIKDFINKHFSCYRNEQYRGGTVVAIMYHAGNCAEKLGHKNGIRAVHKYCQSPRTAQCFCGKWYLDCYAIDESDLIRLILHSKNDIAQAFKECVIQSITTQGATI